MEIQRIYDIPGKPSNLIFYPLMSILELSGYGIRLQGSYSYPNQNPGSLAYSGRS